MTTPIAPVGSTSIRHNELLRLVVQEKGAPSPTTYNLANTPRDTTVTIPGESTQTTFTGLATLMSIGPMPRDLQQTEADMSILFNGIDPNVVAVVFNNYIKGSTVTIWRIFYDANYNNIGIFQRYKGIVTSYAFSDDFETFKEYKISASLQCASFIRTLQNMTSGRKTNPRSWDNGIAALNNNSWGGATGTLITADDSMDRVPAIQGLNYDFGAPMSKGSTTSSSGVTDTGQPVDTSDISQSGY